MHRNIKITGIAAVFAAMVLTASVPLAWAGPGFLPEPPRAPATYQCSPGVARADAEAVLIRGNGHHYSLIEGRKFFRLLTDEQERRAVFCNRVGPTAPVIR